MRKSLTLLLLSFLGCTQVQQTSVRAYFQEPGAEAGEVEQIVVDNIHKAKHQILIQAYGFTSDAIFDALDSMHSLGVDVEVLLDKSNEISANSKLKSLKKAKIVTMIDADPSIAHSKVIIIDTLVTITGSYNWTEHSKKNVENIVVINDPEIALQYVDNWNERYDNSRRAKRR